VRILKKLRVRTWSDGPFSKDRDSASKRAASRLRLLVSAKLLAGFAIYYSARVKGSEATRGSSEGTDGCLDAERSSPIDAGLKAGATKPYSAARVRIHGLEAYGLRSARLQAGTAFFFQAGIQGSGGCGAVLHSRVKEPEKGYSCGCEEMPLRTGFVQMYQATRSGESPDRRMWS